MKKDSFEKFGIAALIPGMQHMIELMQLELDQMRLAIEEDEPSIRQHINLNKSSPQKNYWAKMSPEERSAEMKRRMKLGLRKKAMKEKAATA